MLYLLSNTSVFFRGDNMARMIPAFIDEDTKSTAERKLFTMLRDIPNTDDWYVFHLVEIAIRSKQCHSGGSIFCNGADAK